MSRRRSARRCRRWAAAARPRRGRGSPARSAARRRCRSARRTSRSVSVSCARRSNCWRTSCRRDSVVVGRCSSREAMNWTASIVAGARLEHRLRCAAGRRAGSGSPRAPTSRRTRARCGPGRPRAAGRGGSRRAPRGRCAPGGDCRQGRPSAGSRAPPVPSSRSADARSRGVAAARRRPCARRPSGAGPSRSRRRGTRRRPARRGRLAGRGRAGSRHRGGPMRTPGAEAGARTCSRPTSLLGSGGRVASIPGATGRAPAPRATERSEVVAKRAGSLKPPRFDDHF
jgi:hypothetical protein